MNVSDDVDWLKVIGEHGNSLATQSKETMWPRDTLFKYLQLMEQLQVLLFYFTQKSANDCRKISVNTRNCNFLHVSRNTHPHS